MGPVNTHFGKMFNFARSANKPAARPTPMEAVVARQQVDVVAAGAALKGAEKAKQQAVLLRNAAADAKRLRIELLKAQAIQAEACAELVAAEEDIYNLLNGGLDALTLEPQAVPELQPQLQFVHEDFSCPPPLPVTWTN